jgi:hypothetical protein
VSYISVAAPCLVFAVGNGQTMKVDLRLLDRVELIGQDERATDEWDDLLLVCGDLEVALHVPGGSATARDLVAQAVAFTRQPADLERFVVIDNDAVVQRGELLLVGARAFRIDEVREYAMSGANLPLPGDRLLPAAIAMLVVAAGNRDDARD